VIYNAQTIDEGNYQCVAQNTAGTKESSFAKLTVQGKVVSGKFTTLITNSFISEI